MHPRRLCGAWRPSRGSVPAVRIRHHRRIVTGHFHRRQRHVDDQGLRQSVPGGRSRQGAEAARFPRRALRSARSHARARAKSRSEVEAHFDNPQESEIFKNFPKLLADKDLVTFICDYGRLIIIGNARPHEIEALMDEEIETLAHDRYKPVHAFQAVADGLPALGIVAAVLGIIHAMGALDQSPEDSRANSSARRWSAPSRASSCPMRSSRRSPRRSKRCGRSSSGCSPW